MSFTSNTVLLLSNQLLKIPLNLRHIHWVLCFFSFELWQNLIKINQLSLFKRKWISLKKWAKKLIIFYPSKYWKFSFPGAFQYVSVRFIFSILNCPSKVWRLKLLFAKFTKIHQCKSQFITLVSAILSEIFHWRFYLYAIHTFSCRSCEPINVLAVKSPIESTVRAASWWNLQRKIITLNAYYSSTHRLNQCPNIYYQ